MTDAVAHRGPDAAGYYQAPGIALGHRRLSIIDLATGDQPLGNEDGSIQVVFNGEIYNFAEVRAELLARGHRFRTESDTEIIVHGYEEWGERASIASAACSRSRCGTPAPAGCCSCAIASASSRSTTRRFPASGIVFGSEIKSLLQDPDVPRDWRADALDAYLTLLYVPAPDTIYHAHPQAAAGAPARRRARTGPDLAVLGPAVHRRRHRRARGGVPRGAGRTCCAKPSACG